jgi:hypothetical protein
LEPVDNLWITFGGIGGEGVASGIILMLPPRYKISKIRHPLSTPKAITKYLYSKGK